MTIIGIDLGTSFCVVARATGSGTIELVPNRDGDLKTGSLVSFADDRPLVAKAALPDLVLSPGQVCRCFKRYMGKRDKMQQLLPLVTVKNTTRTAVDASAVMLSDLKESTEQYLGEPVEKAVISVPVYFGELAREDTRVCAHVAGYNEVKLIEESVAAAIYYGLDKSRSEAIAVVDFGGGTLDVTFLKVTGGIAKAQFTAGDSELGGDCYNEATLAFMCDKAKKQGIEISSSTDLATFYHNLDKAREAKEMLSRRDRVIVIPEANGQRCKVELTRKIFAKLTKDLDERFVQCCQTLKQKIDSAHERVDRVLLVGGSSRLPQVKELVEAVFGIPASMDTDPDMIVAKGAAIWAAKCFGDPNAAIVVGGHRYLPDDIQVSAVSSHPICVAARKQEQRDGQEYNFEIVPSNTELPFEFEQRFAPVSPTQSVVVIKLLQGQPGQLSSESTLLREVRVPIEPSAADADRIIIKGVYTAEGLLEISITDELLGKPVSDSFVYSAGLSVDDIQKRHAEFQSKG